MRIAPVIPPRWFALVLHVCGTAGGDEVGGVEVAPVRGLADEERDVDALGKPLVRGDAELADRLLVPAVIRLREGTPEVDRVGEVEAGGAVVHQVDVRPDVVAQPLAEVRVGACVAPRVELDRRIAELEALVARRRGTPRPWRTSSLTRTRGSQSR